MSEKLMTPDELAEYLAVSKQTIRLWCHLGKIPFLKAGHLVRFRKPDIDAWLSTQSTQKKEKKKKARKPSIPETSIDKLIREVKKEVGID